MGLFDIFKKKDHFQEMMVQYQQQCDQIDAQQKKMDQLVAASKGVAPGSIQYRNNARNYDNAKKLRDLAASSAKQLDGAIRAAMDKQALEQYSRQLDAMAATVNKVMGKEADYEKLVATVTVKVDLVDEQLNHFSGKADGVFKGAAADSEWVVSDAFSASVAEAERRDAFAAANGLDVAAAETAAAPVMDEFAAAVAKESEK